MRIERVEGNRKIRVVLSHDDLIDMKINIKTLTPDSPELHSFLFRIMEHVKRETGFNAVSGQIIVEASPYDGGMVLTVTKIDAPKPVTKRNLKSVRVRKKVYPDSVYRFWDFDALCTYLRITDADDAAQMRLYGYEGGYFAATASQDKRLAEFAERIHAGTGEEFFYEHGKLIAEGEKLKNMAIGIKNLE